MYWNVRKKVLLEFLLAIAAIAVIAVVSFKSILNLNKTSHNVLSGVELLVEFGDALTSLKNAETAQRGYIITGNESYLESYQWATASLDQQLIHLRQITSGDAIQQSRLVLLDHLISEELDGLNAGIELRRAEGFEAAHRMVMARQSKSSMDEISKLIGEAVRDGKNVVASQSKQTIANADQMAVVFVIGSIIGFSLIVGVALITNRDITERKRAEEILRAAEARYRDLFENANDIIFTQNLDGTYTSMNKKGEQLTGYTPDEMIKMNIYQALAPEYMEVVLENHRRKMSGEKEATTYEIEVIRKDGTRLPLEVSTRLIYEDGHPVGVQGIARDISERRQHQAHRQKLEQQLLQAQKMESIGRLAGGVAHDFNNLLTAVIGYSQLVLRRISQDDPLRQEVNEILDAGNRAASLTQQLLAFSRRQTLVRKAININDTITNLIRMLRRIIGEDIEVKLILDTALSAVLADGGQIEQVIMNLAVNARDAMPAGGSIFIETNAAVLNEDDCRSHHWAKPGRYQQIIFSDTGAGMDAETRQCIFEPFFTTKEQGKGTGLGLAVVYGIIEQHGGLVHVYSEMGKGTTFKIYLPADEEVIEEDPIVPHAELKGGTETILVADDEEMLRELAKNILEGLGYKVLLASDGEEALQLYKSSTCGIDLMLLDVVMPRMGGREVYELMLKNGKITPVIFMTGYLPGAIHDEPSVNSPVPIIQKPYRVSEVATKVREMLDCASLK